MNSSLPNKYTICSPLFLYAYCFCCLECSSPLHSLLAPSMMPPAHRGRCWRPSFASAALSTHLRDCLTVSTLPWLELVLGLKLEIVCLLPCLFNRLKPSPAGDPDFPCLSPAEPDTVPAPHSCPVIICWDKACFINNRRGERFCPYLVN